MKYIMNMKIILLIINISVISCYLNMTRTADELVSILNKYKNNRLPRCEKSGNMETIVDKAIDFFSKNAGFSEYLNTLNVSQCARDKSNGYTMSHILNGLIIHDDLPVTHWYEYKKVHNKEYNTAQHELIAMAKWRDNLQRVAQHNRDFIIGKQSYSLHLNHLGDLDVKEYFNKFLKLFHTFPFFDPAEDRQRSTFKRNAHRRVPKSFDWRDKGFRPRLEEQHDCGACYAFAVTHAMQAQLYKRHGTWGELSPQQIVDCSYKEGNRGCDGGSLRAALRYASSEGLLKESQYPYKGKKGRCTYNPLQLRIRARRWATLPAHDEAAIEKAVATIGPLAVALNAAPFTFQLYRSGVYDDLFCAPWFLNHAMLLVGYTPQYWILLNWWGKNWGEGGYIRVRRGLNRCGITNMATYVEL